MDQKNILRECRAGTATFLTMAYILFVNPTILSQAIHIPNAYGQLLTATALAAAFGSAAMGLIANYPFALAPGMGLNAYFTFGVVLGAGVSWQIALGTTFLASILFLLISVSGLRAMILHAIPAFVKEAAAVGIGLFLAVIGLQNAGVLQRNEATLISFAPLNSVPSLLLFGGVILAAALLIRRVTGALLIAMVAVSAAAIWSEVPVYQGQAFGGFKDGIISLPTMPRDLFLAMDIWGAMRFELLGIVFMFLFVDFFDTAGSLFGLASRSGMLNNEGQLHRGQAAFTADALSTVFSAVVGVSPTTTFIESAAGIEEGGRTGLTAVVVALLFLVGSFFWPLAAAIPPQASAAVLVLVGSMMTAQVVKIDWSNYQHSVPAFLTAISIPLSFSIANGISLGVISYVLISVLCGKARTVNWLMYVLAVVLVSRYVFLPSFH